MLWGEKKFQGWEAAATSALAGGARHLLSFNEPDHPEQANMDSATASAAHIRYLNPYAGQARIGSPAVTNGDPEAGPDGMGLGWLRHFFDRCAGQCQVDFVAVHWYGPAQNVRGFKNHLGNATQLAQENGIHEVWLTEFGASGSDEEVAGFLGEVLPWMDSHETIQKYAYYMCAEGILVNGSKMSDPVGRAYAGA